MGRESEDVVLIADEAFWLMIRKSRQQATVPLAEVEKVFRTQKKRRKKSRGRR